MNDRWDPAHYERFRDERALPFHDLLALVTPLSVPRAVDLGCGTGELTAVAAARFPEAAFLGLDNSPAMLAQAQDRSAHGLRFEPGDLATWDSPADHGLVLANASLQWTPDHPAVLARWAASLAPGGQLAVQVPANADHPSHRIAAEVASEEPFASWCGGAPPPDVVTANVLRPEQYAALLHELGFVEQYVALRVYVHVLPETRSVVEWVRGTSLTRFAAVMEPAAFERFVVAYTDRLVAELGEHTPFAYPFKRILMWGRRPS